MEYSGRAGQNTALNIIGSSISDQFLLLSNMPAGRPLKYANAAEIIPLIEKYFNDTPKEEWTITGLALALDTSRQTLINLEGRGEFFDTIKRAKEMVEHSYEIDLKKSGRTGTIFALKNFDWKDKQEVDTNMKVEHVDVGDPKAIEVAKKYESELKASL